jgi:hypothetical protein
VTKLDPFSRAYATLGTAQAAFDAWSAAAAAVLPDGPDVVENLHEEQALNDAIMSAVLSEIAVAWAAGTTPQGGHGAFCGASVRFAGNVTPVSDATVLHTTVPLRHAKAVVASALSLTDPDIAWSTFWHPSMTPAERLDKLKDVTLFDPPAGPTSKSVVWVYFDPATAKTGGTGDPLLGKLTNARCNALGLPTVWFPMGKPVVGLSYLLLSGTTHVPTVGDAGPWNGYFEPTPVPLLWGYTRAIGSPRRASGGVPDVPEAVHATGRRVQFVRVPDLLGNR